MDSELRRQSLTSVAYWAVTVACVCVAVGEWIRSGTGATFVVACALSGIFACVSVLSTVRCVRIRSRIGKEEVAFIAVKDGEYKKEPPVRGKRPF